MVSRGNGTHGPGVVGIPVHQMVREADGDAVLSTGTQVLQNLPCQEPNVLEKKKQEETVRITRGRRTGEGEERGDA